MVRKLNVSKRNWEQSPPWLPKEDVQANALGDLRTTRETNELSVFLVDDEQANLERALLALSINAQTVSNIDYALFAPELLQELGLEMNPDAGTTKDETVNEWHRNIRFLSGEKLLQLAKAMQRTATFGRIDQLRVVALAAESVTLGRFELEDFREELRKEVVAYREPDPS